MMPRGGRLNLQWIPDRNALSYDKPCTLDVVVRMSTPLQAVPERRPDINLSLVIDRSSSMQGPKIALTRRAAALVVQSLTPQDFLSIVLFGDRAEVLVSSKPVSDPESILRLVAGIVSGGSTALDAGWKAGAGQVCLNLAPQRLNRVLLLTDGQANVGQTNPDVICDEVHRLCNQGVQTTTMGFGRDYNEQLLRSMAASGEGNHFFVQTPEQLAKFFQMELDGLAATLGTRVRLRLEPAQGVEVEALGEAVPDSQGAYPLADLTLDCPLELLFRLTVPPQNSDTPPVVAELSWHSPRTGELESLRVPLQLPRVSLAERLALPCHPEVAQQLAVAMAARSRQEAMQAMKRGDKASATQILQKTLDIGNLPELERSQLEQLKSSVEQGDASTSSKMAASQSHFYSRGSIAMANMDDEILRGLIGNGQLLLRHGELFRVADAEHYKPRPRSRYEGMLAGLLAGETLGMNRSERTRGEAGSLVLATLARLDPESRLLMPLLTPLAKHLSEAPVTAPSESHLSFCLNMRQGRSIFEAGVASPDSGAVRRIAPLLYARFRNPTPRVWPFVAMASNLTHRDAASIAASLSFALLLWELMALQAPPAPQFYYDLFVNTLSDVEHDTPYPARARRFDGWKGKLSEYLQHVIPDARRRGLSVPEAQLEWGSSSYLLESIPSMIYILENHGHQPQEALRQATQGTTDAATLGALVGAALGALHGPLGQAPLDEELAQALARLQ